MEKISAESPTVQNLMFVFLQEDLAPMIFQSGHLPIYTMISSKPTSIFY